MNFYKKINLLKELYSHRPETQQCYSDCLEAFTGYLEQLKSQMERNIESKGVTNAD